jgi:hypothetical protein
MRGHPLPLRVAPLLVRPRTDGESEFAPSTPGFDLPAALRELCIEQVEFTSINGNAQGHAFERSIAINPVAGE